MQELNCPLPKTDDSIIQMSHGGGGRMMQKLLNEIVFKELKDPLLNNSHDSVDLPDTRLSFTTDSYVVKPIFFPGGDLGKLAVCGTINDLVCSGARPAYLSLGLILEEGLKKEKLSKILRSAQRAAQEAGVRIVTGDTKVLDHGSGDEIFINTAGIGFREHGERIHPDMVEVGDEILLTGDIGRHGISVLSSRKGIEFETEIESDCASLNDLILPLLKNFTIHCIRDCTRGGLAASLVEVATQSSSRFEIDESSIPVDLSVKAACEFLGLDSKLVANEGRMVIWVKKSQGSRVLEILRLHPLGKNAAKIGSVTENLSTKIKGKVIIKTDFGIEKEVLLPSGEQLPRIC